MNKASKYVLFLFVIGFALLIMADTGNLFADSKRLKAKLIRVEYDGVEIIGDRLEHFLTKQGFILADDDQSPLLRVEATEKVEGSRLNAKVTFTIKKLTLSVPGLGRTYTGHSYQAHDYGEENNARLSAAYLLISYLKSDKTLMAKLGDIEAQPYFIVDLPDDPESGRLERIEKRLFEIALVLEKDRRVVERLKTIEKRILEMNVSIRKHAKAASKGRGVLSESAGKEIMAINRRILRVKALRQPYINKGDCPEMEKYQAFGVVLIRVPLKRGQGLRGGVYSLFEENEYFVFDDLQVFDSLSAVRLDDEVGGYFRHRKYYLEVRAVRFDPGDLSVIISTADAEAMHCADNHGMYENAIFKEGRVVLIPDYASKEKKP